MGIFAKVVERVSDHPVLFIFIRGILENDFKAIRRVIRRDLRPGKGLRSLDLGCGPGAFADVFLGDDYYGVDLNARYIDHARRTRDGVELHRRVFCGSSSRSSWERLVPRRAAIAILVILPAFMIS